MIPAGHGDCILVRCMGSSGDTTNIMVDGGVAPTFEHVLKDRLQRLTLDGGKLDLLIVSHIDSDHIGGVLELIAANGDHTSPAIVGIDEVWHNSYRHLRLEGRTATPEEQKQVVARIGKHSHKVDGPVGGRQGSALAGLLRKGNYHWNSASEGGAITVRDAGPHHLPNDVRITVLGPTLERLQALETLWRKELLKLGVSHEATRGEAFEEAFELALLAKYDRPVGIARQVSGAGDLVPPPATTYVEDRSKTNASSITCLIESQGFRCLLLGDAPASHVEATLRDTCKTLPLEVDVLKMSHHGSRNSTSVDLLKLLKCKSVLISTDGTKHGHPDLDPILWVLESQPRGLVVGVSHQTPTSERLVRPDALEKYGHRIAIGSEVNGIILDVKSELH